MIEMSEGLFPWVKRRLFGGVQTPQAHHYSGGSTRTKSKAYKSMFYGERWFRQSELVRKCTISNAYFATMSSGFETVLQGLNVDDDLTKYEGLKKKIDEINKRVNLDLILFTAQTKRSIYGNVGFEIVLDDTDALPAWLLPLDSTKLEPKLDENWKLIHFKYTPLTKPPFYAPEKVLYFRNLGLEADWEGLSDVEPIQDVCNSRHELLGENFSEIVRTLWAPFCVYQLDTSGLSKEESAKILKDFIPTLRAGKSTAVTETVDVKIVNMTPDLQGLVALLEQLKQSIIANYGTPRFLLGEPIENRATAYAEFEAYIVGPIGHIQRYFKREIERNWYDPLTRQILGLAEDAPLPVSVKHNWNVIRITDVFELARAVALLFGGGKGILADIPQKGYELMGWSQREIEELKELFPVKKPDPEEEKKEKEE